MNSASGPVVSQFGSVSGNVFNAGTEQWNVLYNHGGQNVQLVVGTFDNAAITATWSNGSGNWTTNTNPSVNTGNTNWTCSVTVLGRLHAEQRRRRQL